MAVFLRQTDLSAPPQKIDYFLYRSFESKGLKTGKTDLSHFDLEKNEIHTVLAPEAYGNDFRMDVRLILRQNFAVPVQHFLETGLSVYFSDQWAGQARGYQWLAARVNHAEAYPLTDLLNNEQFDRESWLVADLMAGSFVAWAVSQWGMTNIMQLYGQWRPLPGEIQKLQIGWHDFLEGLPRGEEKPPESSDAFQKGFCHAHEGYRIYNGYSSQKSDQALARLQQIGVNAVSITPFSYMRNPKEPSYLPFMRRAGTETDESVMHSGYAARQLGMRVMIKPHIWLRRSWPGDVEMNSQQDWQQFFAYYYRWIRHYAVLSQMMEADFLCAGVELGLTTLGHQEQWRQMIGKLRKIFDGKFTYAANWGKEFEELTFWDAFDYLGLNCYYPLSKSTNASDAELLSGAREIASLITRKVEQYDRPLILTEIGFTSTEYPWINPHEIARGKSVNLEHQERSYRAIFQAMHELPGLAGIYWWKWPTYLEYGGPDDPDFTPNGKPAERVLRKWFSSPAK